KIELRRAVSSIKQIVLCPPVLSPLALADISLHGLNVCFHGKADTDLEPVMSSPRRTAFKI
ncbi:MAG: hypothetical protein WCD54_03010, partial [Pseudolabrys sp.]